MPAIQLSPRRVTPDFDESGFNGRFNLWSDADRNEGLIATIGADGMTPREAASHAGRFAAAEQVANALMNMMADWEKKVGRLPPDHEAVTALGLFLDHRRHISDPDGFLEGEDVW